MENTTRLHRTRRGTLASILEENTGQKRGKKSRYKEETERKQNKEVSKRGGGGYKPFALSQGVPRTGKKKTSLGEKKVKEVYLGSSGENTGYAGENEVEKQRKGGRLGGASEEG